MIKNIVRIYNYIYYYNYGASNSNNNNNTLFFFSFILSLLSSPLLSWLKWYIQGKRTHTRPNGPDCWNSVELQKYPAERRQSPTFHMFKNPNLCVNPPADCVNALQPCRLQETLRGSDSAGPGEHVTPSVGWFFRWLCRRGLSWPALIKFNQRRLD